MMIIVALRQFGRDRARIEMDKKQQSSSNKQHQLPKRPEFPDPYPADVFVMKGMTPAELIQKHDTFWRNTTREQILEQEAKYLEYKYKQKHGDKK